MSRYEDMTFDNILQDSLSRANNLNNMLPEDQRVSLDEGSLVYLSLSKQAARLEDAYAELDALNDNLLVDTQDAEHLVETGAEAGLLIIPGTPALVRAKLNCPAEEGTEFSATDSDYNYVVTVLIETSDEVVDGETVTFYFYEMEAMDNGVAPGSYRGDIEPVDFLDGFEEGSIVDVISAGTEEEDIEAYRERRLNAFVTKACAGNAAYYKEIAKEVAGVGGVKAYRRAIGTDYIPIYIQAADYGPASATLVTNVQNVFTPNDPGDGTGKAPFGQKPQVASVGTEEADIVMSVTFEDGYTWEGLYSTIRAAIEEYFTELRAEWEDSSSIIVRIAYIESKVLSVAHVLDISNVTINGASSNLVVSENEIPILGTLTEA